MKRRTLKVISCFVAVNLLAELFVPSIAFALTEGPSQPEVQSFEPVTTNQMVDLFSGDFTYNIPLFDVGGYPVNLHYNGNITMEQEASWVGLGWNINPGAIQRNIQGLPDDYLADEILTEHTMKPSWGAVLQMQPGAELFGDDSKLKKLAGASISIMYNNYRGFGVGVSKKLTAFEKENYDYKTNVKSIFKAEVDLGYNSFSGIGIHPSISWEKKVVEDKCDGDTWTGSSSSSKVTSVGMNYSSMQGLSGMSFVNYKSNVTKFLVTDPETCIESVRVNREKINNGGANISFLNQVFSPSINPNSSTLSISMGIGFGQEFVGVFKETNFGLNVSSQWVNEKVVTSRGYGTRYLHLMDPDEERIMMDAYSNADPQISRHTITLPSNAIAKDIFMVNGQGIGGVYSPHFSAVGSYIPQKTRSLATQNIGAAGEFGLMEKAKVGVDLNFDIVAGESGQWNGESGNWLSEFVDFRNVGTNPAFEGVYYKNAGEKAKVYNTLFQDLDSSDAIRPVIKYWQLRTEVEKKFYKRLNSSATSTKTISDPLIAEQRERRNQQITILTKEDVAKWGLTKYTNAIAPDHHYGEITVTNPDGGRYVYATPVYNKFQKEVSFAIGTTMTTTTYTTGTAHSGLVSYTPADASLSNSKGDNHLFNMKTLPPHAYSYLLNGVLSTDYQDIDGDGPSPSDYGSYVHIHYRQVYSDYKWRTPHYYDQPGGNYASFNKGFESDPMDNVGTYMYGEKQINYIDTIRTKTHVAIFWISERKDGIEALGEHQGVGTSSDTVNFRAMARLDSIKVYTIDEFHNIKYDVHGLDARVPIKSVYFEYAVPAEELCPGTPNSKSTNGGKLTLKAVSFSYGNNQSRVGRYEFDYGGPTNNPAYNRQANDRWGYYKEISSNQGDPEPPEFPYVDQDPASNPAGVWCLKRIDLPSGGSISINYEQDDYAYVMEKEAMEMVPVVSQQNAGTSLNVNQTLYDGDGMNDYIIFELKPNTNLEDYVRGMKYLYFNYNVKLNGDNDGVDDAYEYISGYAEVVGSGLVGAGGTHGYIKIKGEAFDHRDPGENANPISKAAWQYTRLNLPHIAFPGANKIKSVQQGSFKDFLGAMIAPLSEVMKMAVGYNFQSRVYQRAKAFKAQKSYIRLFSPTGKKKGGGSRVSSVVFSDNWATMAGTGEFTESFGQKYIYEKSIKKIVNGIEDDFLISSGVASYEPSIGNDENPYHEPGINVGLERRVERSFLGVTNDFWLDVPLMEQYFSAPQVGYSEVRVENLTAAEVGFLGGDTKVRNSGYTVTEFYTAQDYPVRWKFTELERFIVKNQAFNITQFLGLSFGKAGASQGYSVMNNDMHGKLKSQKTFDNDGVLIAATTYKYRSKDGKIESKELDNHMPVILPNGVVDYQALVGYEMEMLVDPRQSKQSVSTFSGHADLDFFTTPIPGFTMKFKPNYSQSYTEAKSITTTKLIRQYGILEEIIAFDNGASISTKNLALDSETGEVLVTSTENEYGDLLYNVSLPAHWVYSGMGQAYINSQMSFTATSTNGLATLSNAVGELIEPGDELVTNDGTLGTAKTWVLDSYKSGGNYTISLIDKNGASIPNGTYYFRVLRSGKRNQQGQLVGKIVMKGNPLKYDPLVPNMGTLDISQEANDYHVLNASAITFNDAWQLYQYDIEKYVTECEGDFPKFVNSENFTNPNGEYLLDYIQSSEIRWFFKPGDQVNPYFTGLKGQWRPLQSFVYFDQNNATSQRTSVKGNPQAGELNQNFNGTNMRFDGELVEFSPFWRVQTSGYWKSIKELTPSKDPWIAPVITTQIAQRGMEQESKDALGIYSSALYSGITNLPYAVAQNAKLRNILNENFEDYIDRYGFRCEDETWNENGQSYDGFELESPTVFINHWKLFNKQQQSPQHWFIWPRLRSGTLAPYSLSQLKAHSGKQSLKIYQDVLKMNIPIYGPSSYPNTGAPLSNYTINQSDLLDVFSPIPSNSDNDPGISSRKYILSYWVTGENAGQDLSQAEIRINGISLSAIAGQTNNIVVEGWTKRQFEFNLPSGISELKIEIANPANVAVYFDDLRIQPKESLMKTFVYDRFTFRLVATLDENNFATFFEYDEQGRLVRTKRESERGIITISENRSSIKK